MNMKIISSTRKTHSEETDCMSIDCDVENGRTIRVCNLVPNISTFADVLSMLNSKEIESENHPHETYTTEIDRSNRVSSNISRLTVKKCKDSKYVIRK